MGTISLTDPTAGTQIEAALVTGNNAALIAAINGGLDANNWASGKIFHPNKIIQDSATVGQALLWNGTNWAPGAVSAGPLGRATVTVGDSLNTISTTSSTSADVLGALSVTFTAPSSGNVFVDLNGMCRIVTSGIASASSDNNYIWGLRDSGGDVANTEQIVRQFTNPTQAATQDWQVVQVRLFKSGLTGGNSYTWKWAHRRTTTSGGGTITASLRYGVGNGFASMTVWPGN